MTPPIDTSPEAIAALQRYDICGQHMWEAKKGEFVRYHEARAEIARLTAERDEQEKLTQHYKVCWNVQLDRANSAEAERDEARAQVRKLNAAITRNPSGTICDACRSTGVYHCAEAFYGCGGMRDYTIDEAAAALAARDAEMRNEGRRQAAETEVSRLIWEEGTFCGQAAAFAETPFGAWSVVQYKGREDRWAHTDPAGKDSDDDWSTRFEAQAAAQADYEARILSTLEPEGGE